MPDSTPCNIEDVRTAYIESPKFIHQTIENRIREAKRLFLNLIARKTFEYGHGYTQYKEEFHGSPGVQDGAASWKAMAKYRAPGTLNEQDPGYDPCKSEALTVGVGTEEKNYTIYQTERRSLDICLTDALFFWQLEQQLALWYESLAQVSIAEWEQVTSEAYVKLASKFVARPSALATATGLDTFSYTLAAGATFGGKIAIPVGGLGTIGQLTTGLLDRIYQYYVRAVRADGFLGMNSGMPLVGIAASQEVIGDMIKNDSAEVTANYWAQPGINVEGYGVMRTYKNWVQMNDWNARRYKPNAANTYLERVYPWSSDPTSIGEAMNVNADYINAPFEVVTVILKRVYSAQVPPPNPASVGGGFKFDPVNNLMDFTFKNIEERCENPYREKGYFLGRARMAPEPDVNSAFAAAILVRRCNRLDVVECPECTTTDTDPVVTAVVQFDTDEAKIASTKWVLTLDACLTCQVGDRVTIATTKAGGATAVGLLVDNFGGTTIVVNLDTARDLDAGITTDTDKVTCGATARQ